MSRLGAARPIAASPAKAEPAAGGSETITIEAPPGENPTSHFVFRDATDRAQATETRRRSRSTSGARPSTRSASRSPRQGAGGGRGSAERCARSDATAFGLLVATYVAGAAAVAWAGGNTQFRNPASPSQVINRLWDDRELSPSTG